LVHDLLVVGGGIHGAAVARDAAMRGLRVLLVERGDLASGTSSRSSKLIHGGLRYLETLELRLVREALREREVLLETAPKGLVRPLRFLLPEYRGEGRPGAWIALGLWLYGMLAGGSRLAKHERISAREALELEPCLSPAGLKGAFLYWDAQMDDAALCVAVALAAAEAGAELRTHTAVSALRFESGRWRAGIRDEITGEARTVEARAVVNAAGPWVDEVRALAGRFRSRKLRRSRGTHVVLPAATRERALLLTAGSDRRVFFLLPWGSHSLLGTTDVDDSAPPEEVAPTSEEVTYLLREAGRAVPAIGTGTHPLRAFAGVRSLLSSGAASPSTNPREHRIVMEGTLVSLIGGKYTTHRSLAEQVVDRIARVLRARLRPCATATTPLPDRRAAAIESLCTTHADRLDAGRGLSISEAEVVHAVREERARTLEDVLLRRTRLWLDAGALRRAAPRVAEWMAGPLGWGDAQREMELLCLSAALDREEAVIARAIAASSGR
jgi:glycerol-3-phosphate dehydrogenase